MTPDDVLKAADVAEAVAKQFEGYTLSGDARRAMTRTADDLRWLLRQADFRSTLKPADSEFELIAGDNHIHRLQGITLGHSHADGAMPHGYFGHPEDPT